MHAIEAKDVTKRYGSITALEGLDLQVDTGTTFGLLGTNGAGKTTLFKLLVNHIAPDSGSLRVSGVDVVEAGPEVRRAVGYLPENAGFPANLTGREVLAFHAEVRGIPRSRRSERIDEVLDIVGLNEAADRRVGGYSNGMNRRLGLATALLPQPKILLLDEPTAGLDPLGVAAFHRIVRRLHAEPDLTVVLSSHVLSEVESICEAVAVLHEGRLRASGRLKELRATLDGLVLVSARLDPTADHQPAFDAVTGLAEVQRAAADTLEFRSSPDAVPDLLDRFLELDCVAGFEVREPGLGQLFDALADDESVPAEVSG